jgi:hypothetical protein
MNKNVGAIDRVIRFIIGLVLLYGGYYFGISTIVGIVLIVLGAISFIESLIGFCLIYKIFGISTAKPKMPQDQPQQPQ